ncbi:MAG TPA: peptidylprolyl isomerase, partial [Rhodobacterales bacterium]|nr:peptidylprolyl isomerase [Rhodobacterales bacterium]
MRITARATELGQETSAIKSRVLGVLALTLALLFGAASPGAAQSQYRPAIIVDGEVITAYQLSQRQAFLTLLRAPGDIRKLAADQLTNEALQLREAHKAGVSVDDATIAAGMDEFAARGSLSTEQLLQLFTQNGIGAETFRDFVTAGVTWREFIKTQFL